MAEVVLVLKWGGSTASLKNMAKHDWRSWRGTPPSPLFAKEGAAAKPGGVAGSKTSQYAELT